MSANIADLFRELGFTPVKKTATEWSSPCPRCGGKDRCSLWPDEQNGRGYYWCRQCEARGDGIQLLRDFAGMSYADACQRVGVATMGNLKAPVLPKARKMEGFQPVRGRMGGLEGVDHEKWQDKAERFVTWGTDRLLQSDRQMAWLAARGLDEAAVRRYRLGYNPGERGKNCIVRPRETWGLPTQTKDDGKPKRLWLPRGIMVPQIVTGPSGQSRIERIRIRRLDEDRKEFRHEHKYHVVEGSGTDLLWLPCVSDRDSGVVVVQETELDAYMLHALAGDMVSCLASLTSNIRKMSSAIFDCLQEARCILVALDMDKAGAEGWPRWQATFPSAKRWPVPTGKDAGEAFSAGVDLRLWLLAGIPAGLRLSMPAGQVPDVSSQEAARDKEAPPDATELYEEAACAAPEFVPGPASMPPSQKSISPDYSPAPYVPPVKGIADQLSTPAGPRDSLVVLRRVGITAVVYEGDFRLYGQEKWSCEDTARLLVWLRRNGHWVRMALYPEEEALWTG